MFNLLQTFLNRHLLPDKPVLFGYSGGVDSSCLFHLLKMYKKNLGLNLHVIHIDHGWRSSSLKEAHLLKEEVELLNIPFYLETITSIDPNKERSLEEKYRNERIKIFKQYYHILDAQALLLAHQKGDQAETIFKRIFEGASLGKLTGLKNCSLMEGMKVLRPLLSFSKKQLYELAKKSEISFIEDETNYNSKYLRARQRASIFPDIERSFGKNCLDNLCRLGKNLHKYEEYIGQRLQKYEDLIQIGPFGIYVDLSSLYPIDPLELECFIRRICERYKQNVSYEALEMIVDKILKKASNKQLGLRDIDIVIDRGYLFFVYRMQSWSFEKQITLEKQSYAIEFQGFLWKITEVESSNQSHSWKDFWKGEIDFIGSMEAFHFMPVDLSHRLGGKPLKDLYTENKVPAFLRNKVPNIFQQGVIKCNPLIKLSFKDEKDKRKFRFSVELMDKKKNFL